MEQFHKESLNAGVWYTVSSFLAKGMMLITFPLFTRMMSMEEFGYFSNYTAWLSVLTILTTLNLHSSINRAKYDFENKMDDFVSSILVLSSGFTFLCYIIVVVFQDVFIEIFGMNALFINIMFFHIMMSPALVIFQQYNRIKLKYKLVTILTFITAISTALVSVVLVMVMEDKMLARVIGSSITLIIVNVAIYFHIISKSKIIKLSYWKYSIAIALPLLPHILSGSILANADRIMIRDMLGASYVALYSVPYQISLLGMLLAVSLNQAWVPWFFEMYNSEKFSLIKEVSKYYGLIFISLLTFAIFLGPELVLVFGGQRYLQSVGIMPLVMASCGLWFLYTFYVNVEFYHKKTFGISLLTVLAGIVNVGLNFWLLPIYGFQVAALTTFLSYLLLLILHYFMARRLDNYDYYSHKFFFGMAVFLIILCFVMIFLYDYSLLRYFVMFIYIIICSVVIYRNRNRWMLLLKRRKD